MQGDLFRREKPTGQGLIVIGIPIYDYDPEDNIGESKGYHDFIISRLHFNPMVEDYDYECTSLGRVKIRKERKQKNCFFQLEFFVTYSEDELYKLKNISVKDRITDKTSTKIANSDLISKNQIEGNNNLINSNDRTAEFPGGIGAISQYLKDHVKYPVAAEENGIQGDVIVQFDVEKDGSVIDVKIAKSIDASLDKEALRVVKNLPPRWKPAIKDGKPVRSRQTITVPFRLG